ncbi:MAG: pseudouridine synthase [candidate division WOR-3 bacterium]
MSSRRKAAELIKKGLVKVNGKTIYEPFYNVQENKDVVEVKGKEVKLPEEFTYIILYKPKGVITTVSDELGRKTVMDLISIKKRGLFPIGRLDANSEGLLIITNDGILANRLTHPSFQIEKEYEVILSNEIREDIKKLEEGIRVGKDFLKVSKLAIKSKKSIFVVLKEGKNREIRRMLGALGYGIEKLKRIRIGSLKLSGLSPGEWRELKEEEIRKLKEDAFGAI